MLRASTKRKLQNAFEEGATPRTAKSQRLVLRTSTGHTTLADGHGNVTSAGKYWYTLQPGAPPTPLSKVPDREDADGTAWLRVDGKMRLLRRMQANGEFNYTALGERYYSGSVQYHVTVPGVIRRPKQDGSRTQ